MSSVIVPSATSSTSSLGVRWIPVDTGLWVALRDGDHLGRVDADQRHRYRAYSSVSVPLGAYPTLALAQRAVEAQPR